MQHTSIRGALARAFQIPVRPSIPPAAAKRFVPLSKASAQSSAFSTSTAMQARGKGKKGPKRDMKITAIRHFLHHPTTLTPRPLRFSRNRALRHWTIRRAWSLHKHAIYASRLASLNRQYQSMVSACEELRVGVGDGGRLFRRSMYKEGVWGVGGEGGVPIEYARGLSEWVGSVGGLGVGSRARVWDSGWKRWK